MLGRGLRLVESLQRPVVALVQPPAALDRQPQLIELVEREQHVQIARFSTDV